MTTLKNGYKSMRLSQNWLFDWLSILWRKLWVEYNRSKKTAANAAPKVNQQISFKENLEYAGSRTILLITKVVEETSLGFSQQRVKLSQPSFQNLFGINIKLLKITI